MKPSPALAVLVVLASAGVSAPASAQFDTLQDPLPRVLGEPAERRIDRLEQTVRELRAILFQGRETGRPVVVQPAETEGRLQIMSRRIEDLEQTLQRINGQLDQLAADIAELRRGQTAAANADRTQAQSLAQLTSRVEAMDSQMRALIEAERLRSEDPRVAFDRAMQLFADGRMTPARESFQQFLSNHPGTSLAPEARYYLGEVLFRQGSYTDAALSYLAALGEEWPQTPWGPDAAVKLALSLIETNRNPQACGILDEFAARFAQAPASVRQQAASARSRARCA